MQLKKGQDGVTSKITIGEKEFKWIVGYYNVNITEFINVIII